VPNGFSVLDTPIRFSWREPQWQNWMQPRRHPLPGVLRPWLLDRGSLTRHIIRQCHGTFRVEVRRQVWGHPSPSERQLLGLRPRSIALIREVELRCAERTWVFARTLIPTTTLRGKGRRLAHLHDRPLGAVLFADPDVQRGRVELARLLPEHRLFCLALKDTIHPQTLWARRTLFRRATRPLLVYEIFLPEIIGL
jgi:chorismate--pyruvate lyase